jgi:hypothetical protein
MAKRANEVIVGQDDNVKDVDAVSAEKSTDVRSTPIMPTSESALKNIFDVKDTTSEDDILSYASRPGVELRFDVAHMKLLDDSFVAMLSPSAQKAYWTAFAEYKSRDRLANQALFETPNVVDPMSKLLDGPKGSANPLVRDADVVSRKLGPDWYVTWRVEGGMGDLESSLASGYKVMRRPKDKAEEANVDPRNWSGERWTVRDGTVDPASGDQIYNVMVYIRAQAQKDHVAAMSMVSHNRYSSHKQQFVEGIDNISRDMLSSKERIAVADLDELHTEEHTLGGTKRVQ